MPELPEVEVLARHLDPVLRGRRIDRVYVWRERVIRPHSPLELRQALEGRTFRSVTRRAKFLLFVLSGVGPKASVTVVGHLGMTGRIYLDSPRAPIPRHAAVTLEVPSARLVFEDARQFGRFHVAGSLLDPLGLEPLLETFTPTVLAASISGSSQPIKVRLMDQSVIAGIGNIYASEILFRAGVSPKTPAGDLSGALMEPLWRSIREVLEEAIERGATISLGVEEERELLYHYATPRSKAALPRGSGFRVYDRANLPCLICTTPVVRIRQAGRSTYFCPGCQPENRRGIGSQTGFARRRKPAA